MTAAARLCEQRFLVAADRPGGGGEGGFHDDRGGGCADFRTISEFRRRHLTALAALFVQVLKLAAQAGLVKLGHVALDGTKIKANAYDAKR